MTSLASAESVPSGHSREGDSVRGPVKILGQMAAENGYSLGRGDGLAIAGWFRNVDFHGAIRGIGRRCSIHIAAADGALRQPCLHYGACLHLDTGLRRAVEVGWETSSCLCDKPGGNLMGCVCALPRGENLPRDHWTGYTVAVAAPSLSVRMLLMVAEERVKGDPRW